MPILRREDGVLSKLEYDPEKAFDFVTGDDRPIPRIYHCFVCRTDIELEYPCVHYRDGSYQFPNRPILPTKDAYFSNPSKPSLWQRFLDWWVG